MSRLEKLAESAAARSVRSEDQYELTDLQTVLNTVLGMNKRQGSTIDKLYATIAQQAQRICDLLNKLDACTKAPLTPAERTTHFHRKGSGVELIGYGRHSETLEPLALYRYTEPVDGAVGELWARPRAMFDEPERFRPVCARCLAPDHHVSDCPE